jgi:hypothetical protein
MSCFLISASRYLLYVLHGYKQNGTYSQILYRWLTVLVLFVPRPAAIPQLLEGVERGLIFNCPKAKNQVGAFSV